MAKEIWKQLPNWPKYWVSNLGKISFQGGPKNGILRPSIKKKGYLFVNLRKPCPTTKTTMYIHRAVLLTFVGPPPFGIHHGHHKDNNKQNNKLTNLEWSDKPNQYIDDPPDIDKYPSEPDDD